MENYFNHYTLNSGHVRKSYEEELDKGLFFILNNILDESRSIDGAKVDLIHDGFEYNVKTTIAEEGFLITLSYYSKQQHCKIPILEIAGSFHDLAPLQELEKIATSIGAPYSKIKNIKYPYVIDFVFPTAPLYVMEKGDPTAMMWTSDFARCMAWIIFKGKDLLKNKGYVLK